MTAVSPAGLTYDDGLLRIVWHQDASGFRVEGTVDVSSRSGLAAALAAAQQGGGDIFVDLSGLEFIDMEGLRLLVRAARSLAAGRFLVLQRVPSYVRELLRAVNWEMTAGLRCDEMTEQ